MTRFAITVTLIELTLTLAAAMIITLTEGFDPYITESELIGLDLEPREYKTYRRSYYFGGAQHITRAVIRECGHHLKVRYILEVAGKDFEWELSREMQRQEESDRDAPVIVIREPFPGETGYGVRQVTRRWVRSELVRLRADVMMIVEVTATKDNIEQFEGISCEKHARLVQQLMLLKMGWR